MDELPDWLRIPDGVAASGDPVDGNPFPAEDPRHSVWRDQTRLAERKWAQVNARYMASLSPTNVFECYAEFTTGRFDVWAERGIHVVWSDRAVENFDQWLVNYANATLKTIADFYERRPPPFPPDAVLLDLRNRLGDRIQYWKGEARRYRIEQEAHKATLKNANPVSEVNGALIRRRRRLVREYRQREDLTADGFARRVGMSDTAIRGIINEDRKRFAPDKQGKLVSVLGITLREWYQER